MSFPGTFKNLSKTQIVPDKVEILLGRQAELSCEIAALFQSQQRLVPQLRLPRRAFCCGSGFRVKRRQTEHGRSVFFESDKKLVSLDKNLGRMSQS